MRILAACVMLAGLWLPAAHAAELSALDVFARLPITLFENTPEGLSEEEKLHLIEQGSSEFWEVVQSDDDTIRMVSRPFGETKAVLHVFRGGQELLVAMGTDDGTMCALELWQEDATGGFVPANAPEDPVASDFLSRGQKLGRAVSPAYVFCLDGDALEVRPLFWGPEGRVDVPVARTVRYEWRNGRFEKTVIAKP